MSTTLSTKFSLNTYEENITFPYICEDPIKPTDVDSDRLGTYRVNDYYSVSVYTAPLRTLWQVWPLASNRKLFSSEVMAKYYADAHNATSRNIILPLREMLNRYNDTEREGVTMEVVYGFYATIHPTDEPERTLRTSIYGFDTQEEYDAIRTNDDDLRKYAIAFGSHFIEMARRESVLAIENLERELERARNMKQRYEITEIE